MTEAEAVPASLDASAVSRNPMFIRVLARIFLAAMAVLVAAPLFQNLSGLFPALTVDEHRNPAPAPDFALLTGAHATKFSDQLNAWFDDRIGLRDVMIRAKNQLDFSLFGISRKVYVGKDNWLFNRSVTDNRLAFERVDETVYEGVEQSFSELAALLQRRGIRLIVVDYPDKSEFYPEYLPSDVPSLPHDGKLDRLRRALDRNPALVHIDVKRLLQPLKREGRPAFSKTDIHTGTTAAVIVASEIIRQIAQIEGRDIAWNEYLHYVDINVSSSEARYLSILQPFAEQIVSVLGSDEVGNPENDGRWVTDSRRIDIPGSGRYPVYDWEFDSNTELCADRLPATALFGNSFSDLYWGVGIHRYFCGIRRARTPVGRLRAYIEDLPSDTKYFIFQFLGVFLPGEAPILSGASAPVSPDEFLRKQN